MKKTLFSYKFSNVSVAMVRKERNKGDITAPSFWRITHNRKNRYYVTGLSFTTDEWEDFCNKNLMQHREDKQALEDHFENVIKKAVRDLVSKGKFSFEALNEALARGDKKSVNEAFKLKIDFLTKKFSIGNASIYLSTFNAIKRFKYFKSLSGSEKKQEFIQKCIADKYKTKGKDKLPEPDVEITFDEVTCKFLSDCDLFWRETAITDPTIGLYMRTFRSLINNREGEPYISDNLYPFGDRNGNYKIPEGGRRELALPIEDIWRIENYQTDVPSMQLARDMFVFMFFCNGLNFGDLCRLQYSDIKPRGEIEFFRKKTIARGGNQLPINAPLLPPMVEIINRWGTGDQGGYIFHFLSGIERTQKNEQKIKKAINLALMPINSSLKIIASELGIDAELSTSYTRNSYITHLVTEALINTDAVKKMVGHSTRKDVTAGYVNLSPKKRREINNKLLNPDKKYLPSITLLKAN